MPEEKKKKKSKSLIDRLQESYIKAAKSGILGTKAQVAATHKSILVHDEEH